MSTDEAGRFEIRDLPAGRYTLTAAKGSYVAMQYGQLRPRQGGTPIDVRDGEVIEKLQIALPPGSVITGTIVDDFGDPVSGANVTAMMRMPGAAGAPLMRAVTAGGFARTDDRGTFRLYGLAPGRYVVSASQMDMGAPAGPNSNVEGSAPTYYPGTTNPREAAEVAVDVGSETAGISFSLVMGRMARLSGRVVGPSGEAVSRAMVSLADAGPIVSGTSFSRAYPVESDGAFTIPNVPAGEYWIQVRPMMPDSRDMLVGVLGVTVGAADMEGLVVQLSPPGRVSGRIRTDAGTPPPLTTADVFVGLTPTGAAGVRLVTGMGRVNDDWTFETTGVVAPGQISAGVRHPAWTVKAVLLDGRDLTDGPLDVHPGAVIEDVEVVLTDKVTQVEGTVTDDRGNAVLDATLLVFPGDPAQWTFASRYIRSARPDTSGRYVLRGLRPHADYRLIAVRDVADEELRDPEFLASVREQALRFSLAEGETRIANVRVRN